MTAVGGVLAEAQPWWMLVRDAVIVAGAFSAALVAIATFVKLPFVGRPARWLWRQLTEDAIEAYWTRHREVAEQAVEPHIVAFAERLGDLGGRVSVHGDDLADLDQRVTALREEFDEHVRQHHREGT